MSGAPKLVDKAAGAWALAVVACALGPLSGCEPTLEDVRVWQTLQDGPRKIAALVPDVEKSLELRVGAAMLLVDIEEVFPLADALKATPEADRTTIVKAMLPSLLSMMQGKDVAAGAKAKDTLFYIGGYLPAEEREKAGKAIIKWATDDFSGRFAAGRTTLAQVLPEMGTGSVPALVKLLAEGEAIPEVVKILASFESQTVHDEAATALIGLIRRLGEKAPPEAWSHIDRFTSQQLTPFLLEQLTKADTPAERKDRYFDHVATCGGPAAAPGLAALVPDHDMRWIAAQALLSLDDVGGLKRMLAALPASDAAYKAPDLYDEVRFFCTKTVSKLQGSKAAVQAALIAALNPARPLPTVTAAYCLSGHGASEAIPGLRPLAKSKQGLPGWKGAATLGDVVAEAITAIEKRGD